eukprot:TRINITY_DN42992_c0_g1_i1.p1 TRINITY_DN42992_c0_g1~~TRINITY_DN42992_c0_g1_i1.p1  ORF type:complete len:152 (+),score=39.71 TRINITY_DN42992_c0_g1_i1:3-458(+)
MKEEGLREAGERFKAWRDMLDEREDEVRREIAAYYTTLRAPAEHELGKQLSLLSTINTSTSKLTNTLTNPTTPQSLLITHRLLHLPELLSLTAHPLSLPPLASVTPSIPPPSTFPDEIEFSTKPIQPPQVYKYTDEHPLPSWVQTSVDLTS